MGVTQAAGLSLNWFKHNIAENLSYKEIDSEAEKIAIGADRLLYLPYLMGERSPHNDVNARGCFIGMRPDTSREEMTLAVMEGVAFALRDCIEVVRGESVNVTATKICGGGAKSALWKRIIACVFGVPVSILTVEEGPAYGAAILAMVGLGEYPSIEAATSAIVKVKDTVIPTPALTESYEEKYQRFRKLYPALKDFFRG